MVIKQTPAEKAGLIEYFGAKQKKRRERPIKLATDYSHPLRVYRRKRERAPAVGIVFNDEEKIYNLSSS